MAARVRRARPARTYSDARPARADPRASDAGVTLVEMLVVIAIAAVLAGAAALSLGRVVQRGGSLAAAETLAVRLTLAAETAAATGRDGALAWAPDGYRFLERAGDGWAPHGLPQLAATARLAAPLRLVGPGAAEGAAVIRADLAPPDPAPLRFVVAGARAEVPVAFDGLAARVEPAR